MQGLTPDARGIAVGREALVAFESLDRLVAFLGAYSAEASLDDLLPSMTLERGRRTGGHGTALVMRCEASEGYGLDRLSRLAGATRSSVYVGAGSVFVRYRDSSAPFGYDLARPLSEILAEVGVGADAGTGPGLTADQVAVVDHDFASVYESVARIDPVGLVQRLALRPVPLPLTGISADPELCGLRDMALILIAPGVSDRVLSYLWRKEVDMAGVRVALAEDRQASLLLRLRQPPGRILDVLWGIPGVELLIPVSTRAAVEVGYEHPIHLGSATSCLPGDEMYLFRGRVGRVERIDGAPRFVDGRYLVDTEVHLRDAELEIEAVDMRQSERLQVDLHLRPSSARPREHRASLIAWSEVDLLRRMVYLVPPSALAAARLVALVEGLLVLSGGRRSDAGSMSVGTIIPLGARLVEVAPGVLVPDGHELWPRLRPQLIRELLGLEGEDAAVFLSPDADPILIPEAQMTPLDAAVIGMLNTTEARVITPDMPALEPGTVVNEHLGRFALWGFRGRED